jgi:hypothetical protein
MAGTWGDLSTWGQWGLWGDPFAGAAAPPTGTDSPPRTPDPLILPGVSWTLEGKAVRMESDWSATARWDGGFDQMRGTMPESDWRSVPGAGQGSIVRATLSTGETLYEGRLVTTAQVKRGRATIAAQGHYVAAEKEATRLFVQSRDMSIWQPTTGEPFVSSSGTPVFGDNKNISTDAGNRLLFRIDRNVTVPIDRRNGFGFYIEGVDLKKIAFTMSYESPADETNDLAIRLYTANGPNGNGAGDQTFITSWITTGGNNGDEQIQTIATPADLILLYLHTVVEHSQNTPAEYRLTHTRVWSSITTNNTYDGYELANHIGNGLGWDTSRVVEETFDILPFDHIGSWAEAMTYVAEMEDRYWRVLADDGAGPVLEYADWGTTDWTVYLARGAQDDLTPLEQFNQACVRFLTPGGVERVTEVRADPDPLPDITSCYDFDLTDRQADHDFAQRVGARLARAFSRLRYSGRVDVIAAYDPVSGRNHPYGILPGDTVTIADFGQAQKLPLRVMGVEYSHDRVSLTLEEEPNLFRLTHGRRKGHRQH